jgi:hypothetical protein
MPAFPPYDRTAPTRQFHSLIAQYQQIHAEGYQKKQGEDTQHVGARDAFPGDALPIWAALLRRELRRHGVRSLLDYGAGKGQQYRQRFAFVEAGQPDFTGTLQNYWDDVAVTTYEPALGDTLPEARFDAVVNADVLEHCFIGDLPWIIDEMFSRARRFLFCNVACYPAGAHLPGGENAHVSLLPPAYWRGVFDTVANAHPGVDFVLACSKGWGLANSVVFRRGDYEGMPADRFSLA